MIGDDRAGRSFMSNMIMMFGNPGF